MILEEEEAASDFLAMQKCEKTISGMSVLLGSDNRTLESRASRMLARRRDSIPLRRLSIWFIYSVREKSNSTCTFTLSYCKFTLTQCETSVRRESAIYFCIMRFRCRMRMQRIFSFASIKMKLKAYLSCMN